MNIVVMYTDTWWLVWDHITSSSECRWPWCALWLGCCRACDV